MLTTKLKHRLAEVILEVYGLPIVHKKNGQLTAATCSQLPRMHYYWHPSQRAWCYRPDWKKGDNEHSGST